MSEHPFIVSSGSILQSVFFCDFGIVEQVHVEFLFVHAIFGVEISTARKLMSSLLLHGQDGLLLFPTVLGLWHSSSSVRKMS
jgi:hypothetical protein